MALGLNHLRKGVVEGGFAASGKPRAPVRFRAGCIYEWGGAVFFMVSVLFGIQCEMAP
jgi:hypothetical protein